MAWSSAATVDDRQVARDEVHYRTRASRADGRDMRFLVVNISAYGLMARCDDPLAVGDAVRVTLPAVGPCAGEVRWSLGGRAGIQFDRPIALAAYYELLAAMVRAG